MAGSVAKRDDSNGRREGSKRVMGSGEAWKRSVKVEGRKGLISEREKRRGPRNGGPGKHKNAAAFIKAKVQSALKKRAKEKVTVTSFIAQNNHCFFLAGFCILTVVVAALMKVKDISPGALRKEISAYKNQNNVLKNEVNLVHQENAVLYNRILTLHNHLMRASSQYTRWHTALNEDLIKSEEDQIRPYTAVVPEGVKPGQGFEVVVDGQIYLVSCPKDGKPGDTVAFDLLAQVLSQVVDGGLVNVDRSSTLPSSNLQTSLEVVSQKANVSRLAHRLASPRAHWIRMRNAELPRLVQIQEDEETAAEVVTSKDDAEGEKSVKN